MLTIRRTIACALSAVCLVVGAGASTAGAPDVPTTIMEQFRAEPPPPAIAPLAKSGSAETTPSTERSKATPLDGTQYSIIAPVTAGTNGNVSYIRLSSFQGFGSPAKTTTFNITVVGSPSGNVYGTTNIQVPALASPQYALSAILAAANAGALAGGDTGYALYLQNADTAGYQHVVYNSTNGFFEDQSVCNNGGYENAKAQNVVYLGNVHTSALASYPAYVDFYNYGAATTYQVTVVDAKTGSTIGQVSLPTAANAYYEMAETFFEQQLNWTPSSSQPHVNLIFQDANNTQVANAYAVQTIFNQQLNAYINMSIGCVTAKSSSNSGNYTLSVTNSGTNGNGAVTSSPSGINCVGSCSPATAQFSAGTTVTLTASPLNGAALLSWGGDCMGTGTCTVTMNGDRNVTAIFGPAAYILNVAATHSGGASGTVTSSPAGINLCGTCTAASVAFSTGSTVTLTATPASGATFLGWSGAQCSGTGTCAVTMNSRQNVTAAFGTAGTPIGTTYTLGLAVTYNNGSNGSVTSSPAGISCFGPFTTGCSTTAASFAAGTSVTLTATPASGYSFQGWGGACANTGTCTVTMDSSKNVTATFGTGSGSSFALNLYQTGTVIGAPAVQSSPGGIYCDLPKCASESASYAAGTVVALYGLGGPNTSYSLYPGVGVFRGWGGACSGTGACAVTMNSAQNVTTTFQPASGNPQQVLILHVYDTSGGNFAVTSSPSGVSCTGPCHLDSLGFDPGTTVTLTATPNSGAVFKGWTGDCTGTGTCTVTMSSGKEVTARFARSGADTATTYSYSGNPFNSFSHPYLQTIGLTGVSGYFTVSSPLPPNTTRSFFTAVGTGNAPMLVDSSLLYFSFTDGVSTVTLGDSIFGNIFSVTTDASGNISAWNISFGGIFTCTSCVAVINGRGPSEDFSGRFLSPGNGLPSGEYSAGVFNAPGTWIRSN